jgi:hypothetical protein
MNLREALFLMCTPVLLLSAATVSANTDEPPPLFASVQMEGSGWSGENCEGGEWTFGWAGPVAVEAGPLSDLLESHTAFDTSQPNQRPIPAAKIASRAVTCRDNHDAVALTAHVRPAASDKVQFTLGLAANDAQGTASFAFSVDEVGFCHAEASGHVTDLPISLSVNTANLIQLSPAIEITLEDLENGFNKSYTFDGSVLGAAPMCMGHELTSATLSLRYKSGEEDPSVSMNACLHLAKGETRDVTALGTPEGGRYQFDPRGNAFYLQSQSGNRATFRGERPGAGSVKVEYWKDKMASAEIAGSVVDVVSINNGVALPQIGIYGANGFIIPGARQFPLKLDPIDGYVQMTLENETIASVNNTSSSVFLQPVKIGKTTMQAKTLCGTPLGPKVPFEIVRCTDEVKQQLRAEQLQLKNEIDQLVRRITALLAGKDFQDAATEIAQATKDVAIKTGESIIGTLTFRDAKRMEWVKKRNYAFGPDVDMWKTLPTDQNRLAWVKGIYTIGDVLNDMGDAVGSNDWQKELKPFFSIGVELLRNEAIGLGKTYGETYLAAEKFSRYLGTLYGVAEQLENLEPQLDRLVKDLIRISTRLEYCEGQTKIEEPRPNKPDPNKPKPDPIPVEVQEPVEIPVPEEPEPIKDDPIPPKPDPENKTYGLACRAQDLRAPGVALRLNALRQHALAVETPTFGTFTTTSIDTALTRAEELRTLRNLTQDLGALREISAVQQKKLKTAQADLKIWQTAIDRMKAAMNGSDEQGIAAARSFYAAGQDFASKVADYGNTSFETLMETDECRDRLEIKIDQVRARYN